MNVIPGGSLSLGKEQLTAALLMADSALAVDEALVLSASIMKKDAVATSLVSYPADAFATFNAECGKCVYMPKH